MNMLGTSDSTSEIASYTGVRYVAAIALLSFVYWMGAQAGLYLKSSFGDVTPIWPPAGLSVAIFLAWGARFWPMVAIGEFAAALSIHQPPLAGVIGGATQIIEALLACRFVRMAGAVDITASSRSVLRFTTCGAALPPLAASLLGASSLLYIGALAPSDFLSGVLTWWMGDTIGILVLTPVLSRLAQRPHIPIERAALPRFAAFLFSMMLVGVLITSGFGARGPYLFFLLLPAVVLAALHFGLTGAGTAALALTMIVYGLRPHDAEHGDFLTAVRMLFVGISAFTAYLVAGFLRERAAAEARLREMSIAMQQTEKFRALGTLAGGVAHDFNNLIGIIRGHADLALHSQEGGQTPDAGHLRHIRTACDHAADLVRQILSFSRGGEKFLRPVEVASLIRDIIGLFRSSLPAHIELHLSIETDRSLVRCAEAQVHQIALNLLTNAAQAINTSTGRIDIRLFHRRISEPIIVWGRSRAGDFLVFEVADSGCGIPPELLPRVFEPYFTTKAPQRGTGLGLSVVHGIVSELGGFIDIESHVGRGTTMRVHLPLAETKSTTAPHGRSP